jgi:hypothetical protein
MLELDQLADVLASVSRDRILPLFAPDEPLNANQVCRRLGLTISKVKRVRAALRRLAHTGDLLECVAASFPGLRKPAPTYMLLCVPATPPTVITEDSGPSELQEATEQGLSTLLSTPPQRPLLLPLPCTPTTPSNPCCVCLIAPSLVVLLPCRHQRVCSPCWEQYDASERKKHRSLLRKYPHREKSRLVVPCPTCREEVVEAVVPFC